jgi:hypothetical protein
MPAHKAFPIELSFGIHTPSDAAKLTQAAIAFWVF